LREAATRSALRRSMNPASGVQSAFSRSVALRRVGLKFRMPKRTRHAFIRLTMRAFAYQIFAFARRTLGVFLLKKPGIASTPCTTRFTARTSWPTPISSAARIRVHREWMECSIRSSMPICHPSNTPIVRACGSQNPNFASACNTLTRIASDFIGNAR
jgi:hypothetical protein